MTNYEKHKEEIIDMVARASSCIKLLELCGHNGECGKYTCLECQKKLKQWLKEEAKEFDPAEFRDGDKIIMKKRGSTEFSEVEVVCNRFPTCWMRFMDYENDKPKSDKGFLISYDELMSECDVIEVFR